MSDLVKAIKQMVKVDCMSEKNLFDKSFYFLHLNVVEKYTQELCRFFPANNEILQIASYLHDISAIRNFDCLATHHIESAKIAADILCNKMNDNEIKLLEDAITNHSMPYNDGSVESMILSNADAMSKLDCPVFWISYAYKRKFNNYNDSVKWYSETVNNTFQMMIPKAREIIGKKFETVKQIIKNESFFFVDDY